MKETCKVVNKCKYNEKNKITSDKSKESKNNEDQNKMEQEEIFINNYINHNIKNIEDVQAHFEKINEEISDLDQIISDKVERQIVNKTKYEEKLMEIKEKMKVINHKMDELDKKTGESEDVLIKLCKDIKKLDIGKKNVTETIIILKRIVMVITAISGLKKKAVKKEYKDCISLICVIKDMLRNIVNLKTNNKVNNLYSDANTLFNDLKNQIIEDIDLIYDNDVHIENNIIILNEPNDQKIQINLYDACTCLYYLNPSFIDMVIKRFTSFILEKYTLIFENQSKNIESIDRRIAWLKRCLVNYENKYANIFPPIYNMPYHIVRKFCAITKKHTVKIISSSIEEINPVVLIQTVIKIISFENFLSKTIPFCKEKEPMMTTCDNFSSLDFPFPDLILANIKKDASSQKQKKENKQEEEEEEEEGKGKEKDDNDGDGDWNNIHKTENDENNFKGAISCIFDSYLCNWLKYEEKKILIKFEEMINEDEEKRDTKKEDSDKSKNKDIYNILSSCSDLKLTSNETFEDMNNLLKKNGIMPEVNISIMDNCKVYKSAYKLFYLYKSYMNMILLFSNCQTLYDFICFFKSLLLKYGEELNQRIIHKIKEEQKMQHFQILSLLINTSYYMEQTLCEVYEHIIKVIDSIFHDKVSFTEEEQVFHQIKTKCIKIIILYMEDKIQTLIPNNCVVHICDASQIKKQSSYVSNVHAFLQNHFLLFKQLFNETYVTYIVEKITTLTIQRFYDVIFSFKYMSEEMGKQLLMDTYGIKEMLLKIPSLFNDNTINSKEQKREEGTNNELTEHGLNKDMVQWLQGIEESIIPQTYFNYVKNQMNKLEFLIKIFLSDIYDIDSFNTLLSENNNICTINEIEKILTLREKKHGTNDTTSSPFNVNTNYVYTIKKKGKKAADEVKGFFNKIANR